MEADVINPPANLLGILVEREKLNTLILKLFPGNGGYALVLKGRFFNFILYLTCNSKPIPDTYARICQWIIGRSTGRLHCNVSH